MPESPTPRTSARKSARPFPIFPTGKEARPPCGNYARKSHSRSTPKPTTSTMSAGSSTNCSPCWPARSGYEHHSQRRSAERQKSIQGPGPSLGRQTRRQDRLAGRAPDAQQMGLVLDQRTPELQRRPARPRRSPLGLRYRPRAAALLCAEPRQALEKPHAGAPGRLRSQRIKAEAAYLQLVRLTQKLLGNAPLNWLANYFESLARLKNGT